MTFSNPGRLTLEGDGDQAIELETDERYYPPPAKLPGCLNRLITGRLRLSAPA